MPKVNKADIQKEQKNYRLFEQKPTTFIKTHNADEILEEFNKSIAVIDNDPNYKGMFSSKAMEARKILIIQVMLQIYGNINFGIQDTTVDIKEVPDNMPGNLSNSFWINWFINMKPEEIMLGGARYSGNTFMYLLSAGVNKQSSQTMYNIVDAEENFLTIYNAYCRNYLDEVCNGKNHSGSDYFKNAVLDLDATTANTLIWRSNLSRAKRIDLIGCINDMVGAGMSGVDIDKALCGSNSKPLPFNKIMAKARNSGGSSSSVARYNNRQAAQTIVANINAATKNQSSQGQALKNAILNLPDNILSQQAKQTLTSSLAQTTNKLRLNED